MGSEHGASDVADGSIHNLEDRLQGRALENIHTYFVKPSTATAIEKEWLPLCHLDYLWIAHYTPLLCTFTLTDQLHRLGSASGVVQHLKDSLAEALVLFYPLAGRVVIKDGPPRIHCNDAGAVFTEASVDVDMAELRTDEFLPVPLLSGLIAAGLENYPVLPQIPTGLPALVIQVTHFKCGGITLAANWAHAVADGRSGFHFMKSWSELARGADVSLLPDHRRHLVQPRNPPVPSNPLKPSATSAGARINPSIPSTEINDARSDTHYLRNTWRPQLKAQQTLITTKIAEFTKDDIAKMRKAAMDHPHPSTHLTRADCLSTHLWRTIVQARILPSSARVRLWILVEGRKKLSLPAGYFGNVIGLISVIATVTELLNSPFAYTANLIHSAIPSITAEWFQDLVDWIQMREPGQYQFIPDPLGPRAECGISYLIRFPFYELDFGFGIPAFSTRNTMGAWDGLVFVVPSSRGADHMAAMPSLESGTMSRFISIAHDIP